MVPQRRPVRPPVDRRTTPWCPARRQRADRSGTSSRTTQRRNHGFLPDCCLIPRSNTPIQGSMAGGRSPIDTTDWRHTPAALLIPKASVDHDSNGSGDASGVTGVKLGESVDGLGVVQRVVVGQDHSDQVAVVGAQIFRRRQPLLWLRHRLRLSLSFNLLMSGLSSHGGVSP